MVFEVSIMMKIGCTIQEDGIDLSLERKYRKAVRGVVWQDDKVLMIYSPYFNDYSFPGGGIEDGEDQETSLKREMEEEAGVLVDNIRPIGFIEELRDSMYPDELLFHQRSEYYWCDVISIGKQKLEQYEADFGYEAVWVSAKEALAHNLTLVDDRTRKKKGFSTAVRREIQILRYLLKEEL